MKKIFDLTHVIPTKDSTKPFDISKYIDGYNTVYINKGDILASQDKRIHDYYITPTAGGQVRVYNDFDKKKNKYLIIVETSQEYENLCVYARFDIEDEFGPTTNKSSLYASYDGFIQELYEVPEYDENWKLFKKLNPIWG